MDRLTCPFCGGDDFDDIGLCIHLAADCKQYGNACRRTNDELEQREASKLCWREEKKK